MTTGTDRIAEVEREALEALEAAADEAALERWRTSVLGRSGALTGILRSIGELPSEERAGAGAAANRAKQALEAALEDRQETLRRAALEAQLAEPLDVTLPGRPVRRGRLHPITQTRRRVLDVFARLGFTIVEGPEVELDEYNFGRLRIPEHHPARDMWDTFWFQNEATASGWFEASGTLTPGLDRALTPRPPLPEGEGETESLARGPSHALFSTPATPEGGALNTGRAEGRGPSHALFSTPATPEGGALNTGRAETLTPGPSPRGRGGTEALTPGPSPGGRGEAEGEAEEAAGKLLLRTHTSPMQIRYIEQHEPPIRVAVPGRCYRYEATDATHEWMMEQVELLVIDEGISMANLKGTLREFARQMFGADSDVMMRNSYFPFVEPGVELAVWFQGRWLEIMGAGMVHPEIIEAAGYDPERYTGFAAGMGVERIAMITHGVTDIRDFHANDLRFLQQF